MLEADTTVWHGARSICDSNLPQMPMMIDGIIKGEYDQLMKLRNPKPPPAFNFHLCVAHTGWLSWYDAELGLLASCV